MSAPDLDAGTLRDRIVGTWRMLSWRRIVTTTGEQSDALGPNPFGYINYSPDGRVMVFVLRAGRPRPKAAPPTDEEKIALFDSLFAYVGNYQVQAGRVVHALDGSWNELWTGTTQTRPLSFEEGRLVYTTPETIDSMVGETLHLPRRIRASVNDAERAVPHLARREAAGHRRPLMAGTTSSHPRQVADLGRSRSRGGSRLPGAASDLRCRPFADLGLPQPNTGLS